MLLIKIDLPIVIKLRLLMLFIQRTAISSIFPFMALLLTKYISETKTGFLLIVVILINLFFSLLGGYISDGLKQKRLFLSLITFSNVILFLSMGLFLIFFENTTHIYSYISYFIIIYILNEALISMAKPMYNALALDYINDANRMTYSKLKYWLSNVSIALGMMLGGIFYSHFKEELFIGVSCALLLNTIILLFIVKDKYNPHAKFERKFISQLVNNYIKVYRNKKFTTLLACGMLILSAEMSLSSYVAVRLQSSFHTLNIFSIQFDGVRMFSLLLIINTVMIICLSFFILKLLKNKESAKTIILGTILLLIGYPIVIGNSNFGVLIIFMAIATVGEIIFTPTYESEKIKLIPKEELGAYSALDVLMVVGAELLARLFLILGAFLSPLTISILVFILIFIGSFCSLRVIKKY